MNNKQIDRTEKRQLENTSIRENLQTEKCSNKPKFLTMY